MDGLRRFIQADNHSAVDVGDLRRDTRSLLVQKKRSSVRLSQRRPSEKEQMS